MVCYAQTPTYQFRTTSSYHAAQQSSSVHRTQYTVHSTSTPVHSTPYTVNPTPYTYEFYSTSVYLPAERSAGVSFVGSPVMAPFSGPRRNLLSEFSEDQEGVGELADPAPIGSPLILLFFAAGYMLIRFVRSRSASQLAQ